MDSNVETNAFDRKTAGKVYLVGAGPGDPELITLRGVECLKRADVILYDYLVGPGILRQASPSALKQCLGQHGRGKLWTQDEICEQLVTYAQQGKTVVRLKSGDPAVFGRIAEELAALRRAGIPYEIVPGITAAVSVAACSEIPITHRDVASAVAFITGRENPTKGEPQLDFSALARFPGSLVFYMGVTTAQVWIGQLIAHGVPPSTPTAIVRRSSHPDQLTIRCRLDEVVDRLHRPRIMRPPVIVVVGAAVEEGRVPPWFEQRPLFGQSVLITRAGDQLDDLAKPLLELGAEVLYQPTIVIEPARDPTPLDAAIKRLSDFDWVVFSSRNGVRHFLDQVLSTGHDLRVLANCRLAAVGPGTAEELAKYFLRCDLVPSTEFRAEELAKSLAPHAAGKNCLLIRASRGREVLSEMLVAAGAKVEQVVAYQSVDVETADPVIAKRLAEGEIDLVTVTSSAIARSLHRLFGDHLKQTRLVSISPVTTATLLELGVPPTVEAATYTMPGVVDAIRKAVS
jgi:uroporphyrinogen III methyltransferase/synthase